MAPASSVPLAQAQLAGWAKGTGDCSAWKTSWQERSGGRFSLWLPSLLPAPGQDAEHPLPASVWLQPTDVLVEKLPIAVQWECWQCHQGDETTLGVRAGKTPVGWEMQERTTEVAHSLEYVLYCGRYCLSRLNFSSKRSLSGGFAT